MKSLILVGRVAAVQAEDADGYFGLLLCTRLPSGKVDLSPTALLRMIPPMCLWDIAVPGEHRSYKFPYDLLVSADDARLVARGTPPEHLSGRDGEAPGVCNAHITIATKGHKGTAELQAFWREEVASFAGRWVEVRVELHRYSFREARGVQRVGTRLVLQSVRAAN